MFVGSNHALEIEVENHLANLDKLVDGLDADQDQVSFGQRSHAASFVIRSKLATICSLSRSSSANRRAKSMFSKVRDSLSGVELIASQVVVKTNFPYSACSSGELAYEGHIKPIGRP